MKKTLIAAVLSFTLLSCQSNEQKAKDLIEKHLSETLHDYDSYQSVKWGELDSAFTVALFSVPEMSVIDDKIRYWEGQLDTSIIGVSEDGEVYDISPEDSVAFYKSKYDSIESIFTPEHIGWEIDHTYRAKNLNGAYRLTTTRYYFNLELDSVLYSSDEKEE